MQFSEVSELRNFSQMKYYSTNNSNTIYLRNPQEIALLSLKELLENSLQPVIQNLNEKPIKLGSSEEEMEKIIEEIHTYVTKSELKPLEQLKKAKHYGEFIGDSISEERVGVIRGKRTASEHIPIISTVLNSDIDDEDNVEGSDKESATNSQLRNTKSKRYSYTFIEEEKKFQKKQIEFVMRKKNSLLSEKINNAPIKKIGSRLNKFSVGECPIIRDSKKISVFFFSTPLHLKVPINKNSSVQEVITSIMCYFMNYKGIDHSLMKYPWIAEAYELRILEDDDDYLPEMSFDPLEPGKKFSDYGLDSVAFCQVEGFTPPAPKIEELDQISKEKEDKLKSFLKPKQLLIHIKMPDINYTTFLKLSVDSNMKIKDLFSEIKAYKVNWKQYKVFGEGLDEEDEEIHMNMPLAVLKVNTLILIKKKYADEMDFNLEKENRCSSLESGNECSVLLNDIDGAKNEEFELIKVNHLKKTRKIKILEITQFKLVCKNKEIQASFFANFFSFFSQEPNQKNLGIPIENVKDVELRENVVFFLEIDYENLEGKSKKMIFESNDNKTLQYILSKMRYLM